MGDEEERGKGTRRGMRYNERGEKNPVYMQQDGNQENTKRRGWQELRSPGKGERESGTCLARLPNDPSLSRSKILGVMTWQVTWQVTINSLPSHPRGRESSACQHVMCSIYQQVAAIANRLNHLDNIVEHTSKL